jgi:hypothetical protein
VNDPSSLGATSRAGQLLAALGVIASLVFVGLELRQNTSAVRAQTRQGLADRNAETIYSVAENPELARAWALRWGNDPRLDESLTVVDSIQAGWAMWGMLRFVEHAFLQVEEGLLPASSLDGYAFRGNENFVTPQFATFWQGIRHRFDVRFVAAFEAEYDLE